MGIKKNLLKQLLTAALSTTLVFSVLPAAVYADETDAAETTHYEVNVGETITITGTSQVKPVLNSTDQAAVTMTYNFGVGSEPASSMESGLYYFVGDGNGNYLSSTSTGLYTTNVSQATLWYPYKFASSTGMVLYTDRYAASLKYLSSDWTLALSTDSAAGNAIYFEYNTTDGLAPVFGNTAYNNYKFVVSNGVWMMVKNQSSASNTYLYPTQYDYTITVQGLAAGEEINIFTADGVTYTATVTDPHQHEYVRTVTKDATCTENGEATWTCSCGDSYTEEIPAAGHTEEILAGKDATCTEDGLTQGKKCSVCNQILEAQEVIPAAGHTEEILAGKDATCTENGLTQGKKCSVCDLILEAQEEIPALGHAYEAKEWNWTEDYTAASVTLVCKNDAEHTKTMNAVVLSNEEEGSITYTATVIVDEVTFTDSKTVETEVHEHSYGEWKSGYPENIYRECSCGAKETIANPFTDLKNNAFFVPVVWAADSGITAGKTPTSFNPNGTCTRAQVVTFLWRLAGKPEPEGSNPFTDVSANSPFYKAILWASEKGITAGKTPTTFNPNGECTRGQIVTFLYRYAGSPAFSETSDFTDVSSNSAFYNAIMWASQVGVTNGTSAGTFGTSNPCTRAQVVTFLYRFTQLSDN